MAHANVLWDIGMTVKASLIQKFKIIIYNTPFQENHSFLANEIKLYIVLKMSPKCEKVLTLKVANCDMLQNGSVNMMTKYKQLIK